MTTKYHISKSGNPGVCRAQEKACPLGGEAEHYSSKEEARLAYEAASAEALPLTKKPKDISANRLTPINFDELTPEAREAITDYQGWNFDRWTNSLRRGDLEVESRRFKAQVEQVDRLIKGHKTEKPVKLFRSLKTLGGTARFMPKVGGIFEDRAYMSFSQNPKHQEFLEGNWYEEGWEDDDDTPCEYDLVLEVEAPKGTSALPLPSVSRVELSEQEVLLPRNSRIKILERIDEEDSEGNPRIRLKGELLK